MTRGIRLCWCGTCKKPVWPPSTSCATCLGGITWRYGSNRGTLIEFTTYEKEYVCLVELDEGVRIMGGMEREGVPEVGQRVILREASLHGGRYHFRFEVDA